MRVLVLGATGFVGQALIRRLVRTSGNQVIGAGRRRPPDNAATGADYRIFNGTDRAALMEAAAGVSHIVNCVMGPGDVMAQTTRNVCEVAERAGVQCVVHFSSSAVYGATIGLITELTPTADDTDWYGAAKIACETIVADYMERGPRHVILRPSCIYGPGSEQWSGRIGRLLIARRLGDLGVAGDGCCNLVHIDDVCAAVQSVLSLPTSGVETFLLSGPSLPTWNDYFLAFARALGAVPLLRLPDWRLRVERTLFAPALKISERGFAAMGARSVRVPDPITPSLLRAFQLEASYDGAHAARVLGLRWTPVAHGLVDAAAWVRGTSA